MDPVTLAALGLSAFQLLSSQSQADAIMGNARLNNQINEMNAEFAELEAFDAIAQGYTEAARYQTVIDKTISSQQVAFASQNIDVNFGSAKEIQKDTGVVGYLNTLDIQTQARNKAYGLNNEAGNIRLQGSVNDSQAAGNAAATKQAGILNAAATGLSGFNRTR